MKTGIVGCGLIGKRRAQVAHQSGTDEVVIVADVDKSRANIVADDIGCLVATDWQVVVDRDDVEAIVVATPNKFMLPISIAALMRGKHVLCEKPPGRNYTETEQMVDTARKTGRVLKIGFNHRHHPAIWKAHDIVASGAIGDPMFIRAVYGHGGRPGYDKEWRGNADLSGGGELLDQGVHIVDLSRWFMGDFHIATGFTGTYHWDLGFFEKADHQLLSKNPDQPHRQLEDNAFVLLSTLDGRITQFHTSWTQWKNQFTFEVIGRDGYARINGLGGSYGLEKLTIGHRRPESGPPLEETFEFPDPDSSWQAEWQEFTAAIDEGRQPLANGEDGLQTMRTIAAIYESAHSGRAVQF